MKILQVCKKFPFPLKDGESIAMTYLAKALCELGHNVTLLSMNTSKHWVDLAILPSGFDHYASMHMVPVDNRIKVVAMAKNLFSDRSYHAERFVHASFYNKIREILSKESFDIIQLESPYLAPYISAIRERSGAKIVLRSHNVEYEIWERIAVNSSPLRRWYLQTITPRLKQFEIKHLADYDLVAGITERDLDQFRALGLHSPTVFLPIGLDVRDYRPDYKPYRRPLSLSFIGSLDWMPNVEGLEWFLEEVWQPFVVPNMPELRLHIAGRNTPDWLKNLNMPGITVHGEVPDARAFINRHAVMIAPLLSGGGMRAKILEGMALGRTVISTTIGIEGIAAQHQRDALVADTPQAFYQAIRWCVEQGDNLQQVGQHARQMCTTQFDNLAIGQRLVEAYNALLTPKALTQKAV
jgi:polysaccharide biosynthesis protein PslH